ncbi:hypothetical protein AWC38_SpisGene23392 [Stylophora pistillata]|uniref:Uncharacterized protein n=1 Tax=Stylophora pistillata TaxID=50429 RepID=A0A2B4R8D0_STYPI|nr:hypothetical protein AWC38_SpisGene23392 [Stylophora pistillata]
MYRQLSLAKELEERRVGTYLCKGRSFKHGKLLSCGIIIYGRNDCDDWSTANGTHCKSGYVVIMQTDTKEFQDLQKKWQNEPGQVHGIIYREAFGESCKDVNVVGEGFAIMKGVFKTTSGAFNPSHGDDYHDDSWEMHPDSKKCVKKVVERWKTARSNFRECQNHAVKTLLSSKD